jgi:predicted transcriptional regulator
VEPVKAKSIKMSPVLWDRVGELASKHGLSVHAFIKTVLMDFIEKDERRHAKQ